MADVQATLRRSGRSRKTIDYKQLHKGTPIPKENIISKKWSTTKLYDLEVSDSKYIDDVLFVKVHYVDKEWCSPSYDSWIPACDVIDIPHCFLTCSPEQRSFFIEQLKLLIKENLHAQRKVDSIVNIDLPIQKDLFEEFKSLGVGGGNKRNSHIILRSLSNFDDLLGEGWHWRVLNKQGDFSFVEPNTITFWLTERKPLEEYSAEGILKLVHRGYRFHLRFARGIGNRFDFQNFTA